MAPGPSAWTRLLRSPASEAFAALEPIGRTDPPSPGRRASARSDSATAALREDLVAYLRRRDRVGEVEDIVQEAFVRFYRAGHDLAAPDARPLLFVIARNLQLDRWKSVGRERARLSADDVRDLDAGPRAVSCEIPPADQRLIGRQDLAAAEAVIRSLPQKTRDAFLLHRFKAQTYRQIADRLGVSVSMVEKHIAEALRQLKMSRE